MKFYRVLESDCAEDELDCPDYWVCEACLPEFEKLFDVIDQSRDEYGELECEECGAHFDHEWSCYVDGNDNKIEEKDEW